MTLIGADLNDSGNRFQPLEDGLIFEGITELHLDETLLSWDEVYQAPIPRIAFLITKKSYRLPK
jgi:hypothetical protein